MHFGAKVLNIIIRKIHQHLSALFILTATPYRYVDGRVVFERIARHIRSFHK